MSDEPIKAPRCPDCGAWHPFIAVCPWIRRRVVRYEPARSGGKSGVLVEVVEVEYFAKRIELAKQSLQSEADVRVALKELESDVTQG